MRITSLLLSALCAPALLSCDGWLSGDKVRLDSFAAAPVEGSLSVNYSWRIAGKPTPRHSCLLRPGAGLDPVELASCADYGATHHLYSQAGTHQASLELYDPEGALIGQSAAEAVLEPVSVDELLVHSFIPDIGFAPFMQLRAEGAGIETSPLVVDLGHNSVGPGIASASIAIKDPSQKLDFAIFANHPDDDSVVWEIIKSAVVPGQFGNEIWVLPGLADGSDAGAGSPLFHSQEQIEMARNMLGAAAAKVDMSAVNIEAGEHWNPGWADNASFMEIYVRGYQDSDGDGVGDLRGLASRLPYLEKLGITALWLMPVHESADNDHGYSVKDYRDIEDDYGDLDDFRDFLDQAHQRGIAVIMDYVINHSSNANPLFVASASSKDSKYRDWYVWSDDFPQGWLIWERQPWRANPSGWYYGPFNTIMPDFNMRNAEVMEFHINNLRYWLNMGVDGFRFDAVGMLVENGAEHWEDQPENQAVLKRMHDTVHSYPGRYTVCESGSAFEKYSSEDSCGNSFNFVANEEIIASIKAGAISEKFFGQLKSADFARTPLILSNHDSFAGTRVWNQLDGDVGLYKLAAQTYLLSARNSFTYYGEEIGISTGDEPVADHTLRVPMSWEADPQTAGFSEASPFRSLADNVLTNNVAAQINEPGSLYHHYRQLYLLRKDNPVVASPQMDVLSGAGDDHLLLSRANKSHRAIIAINYSKTDKTLSIETGVGDTKFLAAYGEHTDTSSDSAGVLNLLVPPRNAIVLISE